MDQTMTFNLRFSNYDFVFVSVSFVLGKSDQLHFDQE